MGHWIKIPTAYHRSMSDHLLQDDAEQAVFLYADVQASRRGDVSFSVRAMDMVPPDGFDIQSGFHLALTDDALGAVIKRAWDSGRSIIEVHSHPWPGPPASFSPSDLWGLRQLVPHVWWRLQGRPYAALVFGTDSFDAMVWSRDAADPEPLALLDTGVGRRRPTGLTLARYRWSGDEHG